MTLVKSVVWSVLLCDEAQRVTNLKVRGMNAWTNMSSYQDTVVTYVCMMCRPLPP